MSLQDFLIDSDYPLDKVVLLNSGSIDLSSTFDYNFLHFLTFTPLVKVVWSTVPDFSVTYGVSDGPVSISPSFPFMPRLVYARANSTEVQMSFGNPGTYINIYIRVYGFMPSNVNLDAPFTASSADDYVINSDYNYTKLYLSGVTASSSVSGSSEVVNHNLGYYPQVEVWFEKGGYIWASSESSVVDLATRSYESFEVSTTTFTMYRSPFLFGPELFHYRIYLDEL